MIRKAFRSIISISRWSLIALSIFPISTAHASSNPVITKITDFWFSYTETTQFLAQTYQSDTYASDPQLWLYNADTGELIFSNDDYEGLQSKIDMEVPAGNYRLRAGVCCWNPDVWNEWTVQYELSFNGNPVNTTTTTEVTTSLPPEVSTTTTQPEPPITTPSTTETPTTWVPTTTSTEPTTTSTTTAPVTSVPVTEVPTTTPETTTTELATTTSIVVDTAAPSTMPTTIQNVTTVVDLPTSLAPTSTTSEPSPEVPIVLPPTTTTSTTTTSLAPTTTVMTSTLPIETPTTSTVPQNVTESNALVTELLSSITELSNEEITKLVESIEVSSLTEESISAIFSEEVLNELSDDQVTELIAAIVPEELSDDQALALSEALTDAPDEVKQEFEQQVDVFGGQFDTYVATGSAVSVGARRVLVAAAAASFAMPAPSSSARKQR